MRETGRTGLSAEDSTFTPAPSKVAGSSCLPHPTEPHGDWGSPNPGDPCALASAPTQPLLPLSPRAGLRAPGPGMSGERDHAGQGGICATFIVPGSPLGSRVSPAPQQAIPMEGFTEQRGRGGASSVVKLSIKAHTALSAPAPPPHVLPRQPPRPGTEVPALPDGREALGSTHRFAKKQDFPPPRHTPFSTLGTALAQRPGEVTAAAPAQGEQPTASPSPGPLDLGTPPS